MLGLPQPTVSLPPYSRILHGILEPIIILLAVHFSTRDSSAFIYRQLPGSEPLLPTKDPAQHLLVIQCANLYLHNALITILITWYSNAFVVKSWLWIVALSDVGHLLACYYGMGDVFFQTEKWNETVWINIGGAAFLGVSRVLAALGFLGPIRDVVKGKRE